mmetsp:Transcript_29036/g.46958  ORF Transcript_29036/g.46958 Transcript_29036/m.46958 type:complete len:356 (+) Transcript_29036:3-1070(+)
MDCARYESGMDDSPMFDDAEFDSHTYTMKQSDVGLNSLYVLNAECMALIAKAVGDHEGCNLFLETHRRMSESIRTQLWNEKAGIFENKFWDGRFSPRHSPTNFYPLIAGIATREQADRMVKEHFLNPKEFFGDFVIPTISRSDPAFATQFYWRGTIWGPTNYLVYSGVKRYGYDDVTMTFADKCFKLFKEEWDAGNRCDELYRASGGSGGGDIHYTWGSLLLLIGSEHYLDVGGPSESGLRFGAIDPPTKGVMTNAYVDGKKYDIEIGSDETLLSRSGEILFKADASVVVSDWSHQESLLVKFNLRSSVNSSVMIGRAGFVKRVLVGKEEVEFSHMGNDCVVFTVPSGESSVRLL